MQITRQAPPEDPFNIEQFLPESQKLEIIVESLMATTCLDPHDPVWTA
ncbi:MAG: hypothetical protein IPG44_17480 [Anaerolineales bacterium]|nr:hypothetical protein [Anaerolineales bacterium]